jgi:tetratricopeptide (TPR) repeat protein
MQIPYSEGVAAAPWTPQPDGTLMQRVRLDISRATLAVGLTRSRLVFRGVLTLLLAGSGTTAILAAGGAAQELAFLRGLRDRGYYEYATFEIERLEARKNLPADLRATLDFERAITQLQYARSLINGEAQAKELDRAAKSLDQFARSHPDNPLVAKARGEQAQILLDQARVEMWRLHPKDPPDKQDATRSHARQLVEQARAVFQEAFEQSKTAYEKFPRASLDDPQVRAQRLRAEADFLRAQINLAICTFEEGLTYEPKSKDRRKSLTHAADAFEQIHVNYRSQGAGLRARLWEGKCFEEQGDRTKALGIYNELLQNHADNETVRQIRDHATQFRLACLNEESNKDFSLVVNEATQWLDGSKDRRRTSIGLGIRWQRAVAAERMAATKDAESENRERWLNMAIGDAREVSRFPGEFHAAALAMMGRLGVEQIRKKGDLRDFASAYSVAQKNMDDIQSLKERLDAASGDERVNLQKEWHEHLLQTAGRLRRVLEAADARTERRELNRARYYLAFVDYELERNDEAAILADYAARRLRTLNPELSRESARLALAACEQEYAARPPAQRSIMVRIARPVAEFLIHNWPDHEHANEARMTMARLCDRAKEHVESAGWYASVTEGSEQYAEAQIGAGREYWVASQTAPKRTGPKNAVADSSRESQINEWTAKAEKYLQHGIEKAGDAADANGIPPDWLTVGKTELANLEIGLGRYDDAVKLLTDPPHSVVSSVAVTDEKARPAEGVKARPFASYVYQSLLRAEIGRHQVDASLEAMQNLEKIAGASGAEGVTAIYVSLGKEIEKEIGRLQATHDQTRLSEVRKSFDKFLDELSRRSETMSYGSLLWIAETYTGLGDGLSEDLPAASEYFAKAAHAYEQLIARVAADKSVARQDPTLSLKLRLANCLRRQGDFGHALEIVRGVIAQKPKTLDVQVAAAGILQDWGASSVSRAELRSLDAIRGLHDPAGGGVVWGWGEIAARLEHVLANGKPDNELREKYFEARYNIPDCRRQFAIREKDRATRTKALEVALGEIKAFALVSADMGDEPWRRLDTLYQDIETDLGRHATPLPKPDLRAANAAATSASQPAAAKLTPVAKGTATSGSSPHAPAKSAAKSAKTEPNPDSTGVAPIWIGFGLIFGVAFTIAAVVWNIRRQQPTHKVIRSLGSPEFIDLPGRPAKRAPVTGANQPTKAAGTSAVRKTSSTVPQKKTGPKPP